VLLSQSEPWRSKKGRDQRRGVGNRATWLPKNPLRAAFCICSTTYLLYDLKKKSVSKRLAIRFNCIRQLGSTGAATLASAFRQRNQKSRTFHLSAAPARLACPSALRKLCSTQRLRNLVASGLWWKCQPSYLGANCPQALLAGSRRSGLLFSSSVGPKGQKLLSWSVYVFSLAFCSLLLLRLLPSSVFAETTQEIVAKAKPAVVQIIALDANWAPIKTGTGFFVSADGDLLTNFHVIQGAVHISARTDKGAMFFFDRLVAGSPESDVALLKFQATDVDYLKLGTSTNAVEGETVLVIGNPEGLQGTVSNGIISAFRENRSLIQITAPISPGSSGSPVLDETGQVIGMATLVYKEGQNLNFAISAEVIEAVIQSGSAFATPVPSATPFIVSNEQATAAFNYLQDRLGKPHVKRVWYDPGTDAYTWIGPKFGKKMSMPRSQFDGEIWPDYVKAHPTEQR
jgi:S1-C subfamily serine protease